MSVIGTILFHDGVRGECAAYLGIDLSAAVLPGEGQQFFWIDDHLLQDDARRFFAREKLRHLGFPLVEGGNHVVVRNLADALIVLAPKPCDAERPHLSNHAQTSAW